MTRGPSPIDDIPCPEQLSARVVMPGPRPRVHGYDVHEDLVRHFSLAEVLLLTLTGEEPSEEQSAMFEVAMIFAAPLSIGEAPAHAARLTRLLAANPCGVHAVAAIVLTEQARALVAAHGPGAEGEPRAAARDEEERAAVARLREALRGRGLAPGWVGEELGLWSAILATLRRAGLREDWQLEAAVLQSRLAAAIAEAFAGPGDVRRYPIRTPAFQLEAP